MENLSVKNIEIVAYGWLCDNESNTNVFLHLEFDPKVIEDLKYRVQHLEEVNQKLTFDLELTHAADREKARRLDELTKQLEAVTQERDQVNGALLYLESK